MTYFYVIPEWFLKFGVGMEIAFAVATAIVAYFSFKIYTMSDQRDSKLFGIAFSLISLSYIIWAGINVFVLSHIGGGEEGLSLPNLASWGAMGFYIHMLLFTTGLITLAYTTFKIKNGRAYSLLLILGLIIVVSSRDVFDTFRIVSAVLFLFASAHYFMRFKETKNKKTGSIFVALLLLAFASADLVFLRNYTFNYIVNHIVELIAYIILMVTLVETVRK